MYSTIHCGCYVPGDNLDGQTRAHLPRGRHLDACSWAEVDRRLLTPATRVALDDRHVLVVWTLASDHPEHATEERLQVYRASLGTDDGAVYASDVMVGATRADALASGEPWARAAVAAERGRR